MCEFCTQHGEGEIWYLRLENYLEERLATEEQRQFPTTLYENLENWAAHSWAVVNAVDDPGELVEWIPGQARNDINRAFTIIQYTEVHK